MVVLLIFRLVTPEGPKNPFGRFVPFPNVLPFAGIVPFESEGELMFKLERRANPTDGGEAR
jgi:hypothetical protein